jgi:hypothetical protein
MCFCLGVKALVGDRKKMVPKPQDACALPRKQEMGRPKKSEPRLHQLNLSLTTSELEIIEKRAHALGMRPVHFGRAVILGQHASGIARSEPASNLGRLIHAQLVRLGNNLNQMVRHLHQTGDPLPPDLEPLLNDIRRLIAREAE